MSANSDGNNPGVHISMAGLVLQVIVLVLFIIAFADYMFRYSHSGHAARFSWRLKTFFAGLSTATILILVRCTYRVAELRDGYDGELFKEEVPFIILEGVAIVLAAFALCFGHPGLLIKPTIIGGTSSSSNQEKGLATPASSERD
jgi:hypothetical protein